MESQLELTCRKDGHLNPTNGKGLSLNRNSCFLNSKKTRPVTARVQLNEVCNGLVKEFRRSRIHVSVNAGGEFPLRSRIFAIVVAVALALALGVLDYVTGREWAISAFYLLPTCLAAWFVSRWAGYAIGALCTAAWVVSDMLNGATYTHPLIPIWNAAMLFVFFIIVVWLLTAVRISHDRLERTVARRTAALQAEIEERKRLEDLRRLLAERKISIELTDPARELLFAEGFDPAFGARPLKRAIQKLIQDPLALKILDGEVLHGDHIVVDAAGGKMQFRTSRMEKEPAGVR